MKNILYIILISLFMVACSTEVEESPKSTVDYQACQVIESAFDEADMPPEWYLKAGSVLSNCGVPAAIEWGNYRACEARQFDDNSVNCDAEEAKIDAIVKEKNAN